MRKLMIAAAIALVVPSLALAGGKPGTPGKSHDSHGKAAPKVMYVLKGTLTAYTAATSALPGSVSITVKSANHHGTALKGMTLTFAVSMATKISGNPFTANDNGVVKVRGPKAGLGSSSSFSSLAAFQVIDQGAPTS
ncbi:MAG TPA: hypothetical protein VNC40_12395 [Gaiellaceae bacterium]|nr:hypothetical protein [Gaiellaceae bacterium]